MDDTGQATAVARMIAYKEAFGAMELTCSNGFKLRHVDSADLLESAQTLVHADVPQLHCLVHGC